MNQEWISRDRAMRLTGLPQHTLYRAVNRGELRVRTAPKGPREYLKSDVVAYRTKAAARRPCLRDGCANNLSGQQKKFCSSRCLELNRPKRYTQEIGRAQYLRNKHVSIARSSAWAQAHPERAYEHYQRSRLMRRYGITIAQFKLLEQDSEGVCWICSLPQKERRKDSELRSLADHDHARQLGDITGVRGLLCTTCNVRLKALEDREWFAAALLYKLSSAHLLVLESDDPPRLTGTGLKYGLTNEQRSWLEKRCGGMCEICRHVPLGIKQNRLNIDHDHAKMRGEPGFIRGLVCSHCNTKLGVLDDLAFTAAGLTYLEFSPGRAQHLLTHGPLD